MTVAELIKKLQDYSPDAKVVIEGCDCNGDAVDVEWYDPEKIIITRKD